MEIQQKIAYVDASNKVRDIYKNTFHDGTSTPLTLKVASAETMEVLDRTNFTVSDVSSLCNAIHSMTPYIPDKCVPVCELADTVNNMLSFLHFFHHKTDTVWQALSEWKDNAGEEARLNCDRIYALTEKALGNEERIHETSSAFRQEYRRALFGKNHKNHPLDMITSLEFEAGRAKKTVSSNDYKEADAIRIARTYRDCSLYPDDIAQVGLATRQTLQTMKGYRSDDVVQLIDVFAQQSDYPVKSMRLAKAVKTALGFMRENDIPLENFITDIMHTKAKAMDEQDKEVREAKQAFRHAKTRFDKMLYLVSLGLALYSHNPETHIPPEELCYQVILNGTRTTRTVG